MQRIKGVTFSHLLTNRCLTPGRLVRLLEALRTLHCSGGDPGTALSPGELRPSMGANYLPKVTKRFSSHRATYRAIAAHTAANGAAGRAMDPEAMFGRIEAELSAYAAEERWRPSNVIHGDPVFSNVLLTDDGRVYLLDMRGELGCTLTLQGDLTYDLSKVYQSLLGYDYIILGQPLVERDVELLEELRQIFRAFVREHYPEVRLSDVVKITASHFFGIVPLHVNAEHQAAYLHTAAALLSSLPPEDSPARVEPLASA